MADRWNQGPFDMTNWILICLVVQVGMEGSVQLDA
jgi:hypothetical protein